MSVAGLCGVCNQAEATFVCDRCGTQVCETHYDSSLGVCSECATEIRASQGESSEDVDPEHINR